MKITLRNTTDRPKSNAPRRFWMLRCNNGFCDSSCGYNSATPVSGTASSGSAGSLTGAALVGISSMIGARIVIVGGTNKGAWRKIKTHNTGTGAVTFNNFSAAIDNTSEFVLDCDKLKTSCTGFSNQTKFDGYDDKEQSTTRTMHFGNSGLSSFHLDSDYSETAIASDTEVVPLVYGYGQVTGKLIASWKESLTGGWSTYHNIYGFCEGPIAEIISCLVNDTEIDRSAWPNAYEERLGVAGQIIQASDFGGRSWNLGDRYWPRTVITGMRGSANTTAMGGVPTSAIDAMPFVGDDVVLLNIKGLKVQKYLANGAADGVPAFSENPIWCMLDYMMNRAEEPYTAGEIDFAVAKTSADLCTTLGYTLRLTLTEQKSDDEILTLMRNSCRAYFTYPSGKIAINIEHLWSGAAAHSFDDLSGGKTLGNVEPGSIKPYKRSKDDIYNRVVVSYIDVEERKVIGILAADLAAGATTISYTDRQGTFAASGTLYIGGEAVTYTGSTHNSDGTGNFTGCSARTNAYDYGYPIFQGAQTFPERTAIWYDEPHQKKIHQVNALEIDGSCIGTYRQAYAIASWHGKKSLYGNQNVKWRGFRPALPLTVGDQIKLTFKKRGWIDWKFRITAMSEGNDNKLDFDAELYEDSFYPELMGTATPPQTSILPSPFAQPAHVTGVTLAEGGLAGVDGTYVPSLTVTYALPTEKRFWHHAIIQVKVNSGDYITYGDDGTFGAGFSIDCVRGGFTKGDTVTVRVISVSEQGISATADTAPTANRTIAASIITLTTPTGLALEGGGTVWGGRKFVVTWDPQGTGGLDPSYVSTEVEIWTGGVDRLLIRTKDCRYEYNFGDGISAALDSYIVASNGAVTIKVRRTSALANNSAQASISLTQAAPANPQNAVIQALPRGAQLTWDKNSESDFKEYQVRTKITAGGTFGSWQPIQDNTFVRMLTAAEIVTYGRVPAIYFEVKTIDLFGNASSATSANVDAIYLGVTNLDVDDMSADKILVGSLRGINVQSGTFMTKGSYLTEATAGIINLLTENQASIETDTTGFTADLGAISCSTEDQWTGASSLKYVTTSDTTANKVNVLGPNLLGSYYCFPFSLGKTFTFSMYFKSPVANVRLFIYGRNSSGTAVESFSSSITTSADWTRVSVTCTSANAATVGAHLIINNYSGYGTMYFDGLQWEEAASASAWQLPGVLYVKDTTDFPSSGSGWIIDATNDRDAFSWTGKTSTTLTGCSGVLAHNNGATIVPAVKNMVIDSETNEMRFFGNRGDGVIAELCSIGFVSGSSDVSIGLFGSFDSSRRAVWGQSHSTCAIVGQSIHSDGVYGVSADGIGLKGSSADGSPLCLDPRITAPTTSVVEGCIYYNSTTKTFYGYNGTTWIAL